MANFGCGSSREYAPSHQQAVFRVIASTFARIFMKCHQHRTHFRMWKRQKTSRGNEVKVDSTRVSHKRHKGKNIPGTALPGFHQGYHRKGRLAECNQVLMIDSRGRYILPLRSK